MMSNKVRMKATEPMYHLIYVSQATRPMSEDDLAAVLKKAVITIPETPLRAC
jgi:hypothetical protein